jgi:HEAT repeat protein
LNDVNLAELLAALEHENKAVYKPAMRQLAELGEAAVLPVIELLQSEKPRVRWRAVKILGRITDHRAIEPLIACLKDPDEAVRRATAYNLGFFDDERVTQPLISVLDDEDYRVVETALESLKDVEAVEKSINFLIDILQDATYSYEERGQAAQKLHLFDAKNAIPVFINLLMADNPDEFKEQICRAAWTIKDLRLVEPMLTVFHDADIYLKTMIVQTLGWIRAENAVPFR